MTIPREFLHGNTFYIVYCRVIDHEGKCNVIVSAHKPRKIAQYIKDCCKLNDSITRLEKEVFDLYFLDLDIKRNTTPGLLDTHFWDTDPEWLLQLHLFIMVGVGKRLKGK
ncbi:hypothetical protein CEXT_687061 [Caerostris extrusa]|uniref:Uncharacterized protein n=1 Tax=Caerostris extrusa TaxID=172846 RepID=A0AAV4M4J3_CAEEX|nr:hypothetical protein CEXT_687061 [Caerostris extrusa]